MGRACTQTIPLPRGDESGWRRFLAAKPHVGDGPPVEGAREEFVCSSLIRVTLGRPDGVQPIGGQSDCAASPLPSLVGIRLRARGLMIGGIPLSRPLEDLLTILLVVSPGAFD